MESVDTIDGEQVVTPPAATKPGGKGPKQFSAAEQLEGQDERSIYEWLSDIGSGEASVKIKLSRVAPLVWKGHNIKGYLDEYSTPFTEADIRERFGGGRFQAKTFKSTGRGWQYAATRSFDVSGDPKVTSEHHDMGDEETTPVTPLDSPATARAMSMMERQATEERKRAERFEEEARQKRNQGPDTSLIEMALGPLRDQMKALGEQLIAAQKVVAEKDAKIIELVTRKPENTFQDTLLGKMIDGESARIEGLRANHDSELRQIRENHSAEIKQERERGREALQQREDAHRREIDTIRGSQAQALDGLKVGYEGRIEALKSRLEDLNQRLGLQGTELVTLREKKDKGPIEHMEELAMMKNAMETLGISGGQEQGSVLERIAMGVLESPVVKAVASRMENAPAAPPAQPQRRRRPAQQRQEQAPAQQEVQVPADGSPAAPGTAVAGKRTLKLSPVEIKAAVSFMENAVRNDQDPIQFAESAKSMVPADILMAIKQMGVEEFLTKVAKVETGSPLASTNGHNFLRKVVNYLLKGVTE